VSTLAGLIALATSTAAFGVDPSQPTLNREGDLRADRGISFVDEAGDFNFEWDITGGGQVSDVWGNLDEGDIPIIGDFDGDGRNDPAVYRPGMPSRWFINGTATGPREIAFGEEASGDVPLHGDFDGDGLADIAVARPGPGNEGPWTWFIRGSAGRITITQWGNTETDTAVPANYIADGRTDIAVRRFEDDGTTAWYIRNDNGSATRIGWGEFEDFAVTGDYDADGRSDVAVVRTEGDAGSEFYRWFIRLSSGGQSVVDFGELATDIPVWHDETGDGRTDLGVFRDDDETTSFIMRRSNDGGTSEAGELGFPGDLPIQVDYFDLINGAYDPPAPVMAASADREAGPAKNLKPATERVARGS